MGFGPQLKKFLGRQAVQQEFIIREKPRDMSFEVIRNVLQRAHQQNFDKGIVMTTPTLSAEELEKKVGPDGKCFIALKGDEVVGTASFRIRDINRWYHTGKTAEFIMDAIVPEYQGNHIFPMLEAARMKALEEIGIKTIRFDTAEKNRRRQKLALKNDFVYVDFVSFNANHYSVVMFRWLEEKPFSKAWCLFRYYKKKIHLKYCRRPR